MVSMRLGGRPQEASVAAGARCDGPMSRVRTGAEPGKSGGELPGKEKPRSAQPGSSTLHGAASAESSSTGASERWEEAVKLRISHGGRFVQDARGAVKYVGGEHYLDRVPAAFRFADLAHRLSEKANHSVSLRYQVPGEPLDEDELVAVSDNLDMQEMYEEYGRAVQQAQGKAPRLRIFLYPGVEEDLTPEQYQDGSSFFAEAREKLWHSGLQQEGSGRAGGRGTAEQTSSAHSAHSAHSSFSSAHHGPGAGWTSPRSKQLEVRAPPDLRDIWGRHQPASAQQPEDQSAEDFGVATPDAALEELRLYNSWDRAGQGKRYGLPTHISAFGDGCFLPEGVRLPSHISIFGNNTRGGNQTRGQARAAPDGDYALRELPADLYPANAQGAAVQDPALHRTLSNFKPVYRSVPHVPREAVRVLGCIAEGSFGEVSLAKTAQWGELAVKWLKYGKYERHLDNFWQEADMLARLNHPNVLRLYGVVTASREDLSVVGIMTEVARGGSLTANLRNFACPLPLRFRAQLALQIAQGMAYLHATQIVHFDLKPDNLLLDMPMQASLMYDASCHVTLKVADFGLSKTKQRSYVSGVQDLRGTLPFMAPELVNDPDRVSEKADCWSFGMLMWELLTLQSPFQELSPSHIISGLMRGILQPEIPAFCEQAWLDLMLACWSLNPVARPSFTELADRLEMLVDNS